MNPRLILKQMIGNAVWGRQNLIKFEDVAAMTRDWCRRLPCAYDLVVGIPRTGLTIAGIISDSFAIPLSTPEKLPDFWSSDNLIEREIRKILIVEDGTMHGTNLFPAKAKAYDFFPGATVHMGSLLVNKNTIPLDTYGFMLCDRVLYEWGLLEVEFSQNVASDLDGVLCHDPPPFTTEAAYVEWMRSVAPYKVPVYALAGIFTSRHEKYRDITVEWLKHNGVRYQRLIMAKGQTDSMTEKVTAINKYQPEFFLESNEGTARELHYRTGVPVICISTMRLYS
jgi:uncharacterized HAD superfamily protein